MKSPQSPQWAVTLLSLCLALSLPQQARAEDKASLTTDEGGITGACIAPAGAGLGCALIMGETLKPAVERIPGAWDKFKHCTLSCQIGLFCPPTDTFLLGLGKEIWDIFGPGNAEWADLNADAIGTMLSLKPGIRTRQHCIDACAKRFPLKK